MRQFKSSCNLKHACDYLSVKATDAGERRREEDERSCAVHEKGGVNIRPFSPHELEGKNWLHRNFSGVFNYREYYMLSLALLRGNN